MISHEDLWYHMKTFHTTPEYYQLVPETNVPILSDDKLFENYVQADNADSPRSKKSGQSSRRSSPKRKRGRRSQSHSPRKLTPENSNANTSGSSAANNTNGTKSTILEAKISYPNLRSNLHISRKDSSQDKNNDRDNNNLSRNPKRISIQPSDIDIDNKYISNSNIIPGQPLNIVSENKPTSTEKTQITNSSKYNIRQNAGKIHINRQCSGRIRANISSCSVLKLAHASQMIQKSKSLRKYPSCMKKSSLCKCKSIMQYMDKLAALEETTNNLWAFDYDVSVNCNIIVNLLHC